MILQYISVLRFLIPLQLARSQSENVTSASISKQINHTNRNVWINSENKDSAEVYYRPNPRPKL